MNSKLLKVLNYLSITITLGLTILFFVNLLGNPVYRNDSRFLMILPTLITQPLLLFISIIISLKANQQKGNILFALFLSLISDDWVMQLLRMMNKDWIPDTLLLITSIITGTVYIKAFQCFPRQISKEDIQSVFPKSKFLTGYVTLGIKNNTWFIFPCILAAVALIGSPNLMDLFILITAVMGLYVNFKKSTSNERDKILWLFWGVMTFTFLVIIHLMLNYFNKDSSNSLKMLFGTLTNSILIISLLMSLFFSNAFDTGILIRRTLVDGFLFILIVISYNTLEHYFLHWLSHTLEISDVLLSSVLSGIFVLAFSPLHHKLMSYLEKTVKRHPSDQAEKLH